MSTGLEKLTVVGWMTEPEQRAPIRTTQAGGESFTATGAGTTTTTVATALTHATDEGYVGLLLKCVSATLTQNVGVLVEVLAFNAGTDTLTHTEFPGATAAGDQFVLWLPPDPVIVEGAAGATTVDGLSATARDTQRDEADFAAADAHWLRGGAAVDQYIGDTVVARTADNIAAGTLGANVTAFNAATGAFTHTVFAANTALGDLYYLRRFPKFWGQPTFDYGYEDLPHESQRGNFDADQSIKGCKFWTLDGVLPLKGSGTAAGDGTLAVAPPELARPLGNIFAKTASTGEAIAEASTTVLAKVTNGTAAQFPVGSFVLDSAGQAAVVIATAAGGAGSDEISLRPALARAPVVTEILYGGYSYEPLLTGHLTMTVDSFVGGVINVKGYGGLPTVKIVDFGRNKVPKVQLSYKGNVWVEEKYAKPSTLTPVFDTLRPISAAECVCNLVATGSTTNIPLVLEDANIDLGLELVQEEAFTLPDAVYGYRIVGMKPVLTVTCKLDTAAPVNTFVELQRAIGSQTFSIMLQHGRDTGNVVAFYAHKCAWLSPKHAVADNLRKVTFTAEILASELALMPMCALGFL
jgi:hypothetical protein